MDQMFLLMLFFGAVVSQPEPPYANFHLDTRFVMLTFHLCIRNCIQWNRPKFVISAIFELSEGFIIACEILMHNKTYTYLKCYFSRFFPASCSSGTDL